MGKKRKAKVPRANEDEEYLLSSHEAGFMNLMCVTIIIICICTCYIYIYISLVLYISYNRVTICTILKSTDKKIPSWRLRADTPCDLI